MHDKSYTIHFSVFKFSFSFQNQYKLIIEQDNRTNIADFMKKFFYHCKQYKLQPTISFRGRSRLLIGQGGFRGFFSYIYISILFISQVEKRLGFRETEIINKKTFSIQPAFRSR